MSRTYVWQMIKEAVEQSESPVISYGEIKDYIAAHYASVNPATINCQIISCSVNQPSRIHYPENHKPRLCDTQYDFLFNVGRGNVVRYNPATHGQWIIRLDDEGKPTVAQLSGDAADVGSPAAQNKPAHSPSPSRGRNNPAPNMPKPCKDELRRYLDKWDRLENYTMQERALNKLFIDTYPANTDVSDILIKVSVLNDFYSTNIFSVFSVARHIHDLRIDDRLRAGDETLVNDIALVKMENGSTKNFYSFATKYCSHHGLHDYPIYDSYVDKVLRHCRDIDGFAQFGSDALKDYPSFKRILLQFRQFYGLGAYGLKDIDRYIWQLGKDTFPITYTKKSS